MKKPIIKKLLIVLAILLIGFCVGWFERHSYALSNSIPRAQTSEVRINSPEYKFINPVIYRDTNKEIYPEFKTFLDSVSAYISVATAKHDVDSASVYIRSLDNGHWSGINEDQKYQPASMLKVAIMIAYLKHAVDDPQILSQRIYYQAGTTTDQYYVPSHLFKNGYYTTQQLMEAMILYSDNTAEAILAKADSAYISQLYKDFQLPSIPVNAADYAEANFMSVKSYSTLFRALYNGTYLPWNLSEQALKLLSLADFKDGLANGVPEGMIISHKFGERTSKLENGQLINKELHDCGIVYYPEHPYLLCVMTRGQNFPDLAAVISDISKLAYTYVNKNNK